MNKIKQKIMAMGLVGLISLTSMNCSRGRGEPGAHLTGNRLYARSATIEYDEKPEKYKSSDKNVRTVMIFDLDGKRGLDNKLDAEEVMIYKGDLYIQWYAHLVGIGVSEWKHYVAPGTKNLLIENNITSMTAEQRALYSGILNADPLETYK